MKKKKKRKFLRKRSKSKATIDKADAALQNWYRATFTDAKCEVCLRPFEVMHHHNEKSKSNAGRFHHDNLIFLCHRCHSLITFGDNNIVATYSLRRGEAWVERMKKLKRERRGCYGKKELEEIIRRYEFTGIKLKQESLRV